MLQHPFSRYESAWRPTHRPGFISPFFATPMPETFFRSFRDFYAPEDLMFPSFRTPREYGLGPTTQRSSFINRKPSLEELLLDRSNPLEVRESQPKRIAEPFVQRSFQVQPPRSPVSQKVSPSKPAVNIPIGVPRTQTEPPSPSASSSHPVAASSSPVPSPARDDDEDFLTPPSEENPQDALGDRLKLYGLKEKTAISGDGNCQFSALADQLYDDPSAHAKVRKMIVNWLRDNPNYTLPNGTRILDYLQTEWFPCWEDYCEYMEEDKVWGDHFTLIAASELFQIKIVIVSSIDVDPGIDPFTVIIPKRWNKIVYLSHLHELHYSSLTLDD